MPKVEKTNSLNPSSLKRVRQPFYTDEEGFLSAKTTKIDIEGFNEKLLRRTKSEGTVSVYGVSIEKFKTFCGEKLGKPMEEVVNDLVARRSDVYELLDKFVGWITAHELMPRTVATNTAAVKKFLRYHGVRIINEEFKERVTLPMLGEIPDVPLEKPTLRKLLLSDMPMPLRVAVGIMASCGSRIGETLQLKVSDIHFDENPVRIHFRAATTKATKRGRFDRDTFITPEISEMTKTYIETKRLQPSDNLFPKSYTPKGFRIEFILQLKKLGMDQKLEGHPYLVIHPHVFRKFFSRLVDPIVGITARNALTGHIGYLDTYTKKPLHERQDDYRKCIPVLSVLSATTEEETKLQAALQTWRTMGLSEELLKLMEKEMRDKNLFVPDEEMMTKVREWLTQAWGLRAPERRPLNAGVW